jgi:hypothetical protein
LRLSSSITAATGFLADGLVRYLACLGLRIPPKREFAREFG